MSRTERGEKLYLPPALVFQGTRDEWTTVAQPALLLGRFDRYKPHSWAPHRFADRLGVGGIVLVALDVGLYILRRHQTNLMSELRQLARPVVRRGAGLHADEDPRQGAQ